MCDGGLYHGPKRYYNDDSSSDDGEGEGNDCDDNDENTAELDEDSEITNQPILKKDIIVFDVDGTLVESSLEISDDNAIILNKLRETYDIAICGGGTLDKILKQMNNKVFFDHYFTECGCVYNKHIPTNTNINSLTTVYKKNIRNHVMYDKINILIKECLSYFSEVEYTLTGHFIDLRCGIIYVSCIGMQASEDERNYFKILNKDDIIRKTLLEKLHNKLDEMNLKSEISVTYGGTVGIAIYPCEYDKIQILETINKYNYDNIIYFGDKYEIGGNDHLLIHSDKIIGHKIDAVDETFRILKEHYI